MIPLEQRPLTTAWSEWSLLRDHPWDVYVTCTFPTMMKANHAIKIWNRFAHEVAKDVLPCRQARREGLPWVATVEEHQSGSVHIHALMGGLGEAANTPLLLSQWLACSGSNIIDVRRYDPT